MSTVTVTLPDGSTRTYPAGVTPGEVAASIGRRLAEAAGAARAHHGQAGGVQAAQGGRGLLAGRRAPAHAPAHLRDGLGLQSRPRRPPAPAGRGRTPRPPAPRGGARPHLLPRGA